MVSATFNGEFNFGSPASNTISVLEGGALRSVVISFATCLKKISTLILEKVTHGV